MSSPEETTTLNDFLSSIKTSFGVSEEQSLAIYHEAQQFPTLKEALSPFQNQLVTAILHHDTGVLDAVLQKTFLTVQKSIQTLPSQIQPTIEQENPITPIDSENARMWSKKTITAIDEGKETITRTGLSKSTTNREFIKRSVEQFSKRNIQVTPEIQERLIEKVVQIKTQEPVSSSEEILERAVNEIIPNNTPVVIKFTADTNIKNAVEQYTPVDISLTTDIINASNPDVFIQSFTHDITSVPETKINGKSISDALTKAQLLSSSVSYLTVNANNVTYTDFFKNISSPDSSLQRSLAPAADAIFNRLPKEIQSAVALRVLESSWHKQTQNPSFLQKILGDSLQSDSINKAIQNGNRMFASERQSAAIMTRSQVFFSDLVTTVFHVNISQEYLQLAALNQPSQLPSSAGLYLSLLATKGGDLLAKSAMKKTAGEIAKEAGKKAAVTAIGKSLGAFFGSFLGPGIGTAIGYFLGDVIIDKALSFIVDGAKKLFSFISFDWLGKMVSGTYEAGPLLKDSTFIIALIFVLPIFFFSGILSFIPSLETIFPFFQSPQTYQRQVDNAMISGIGGAAGGGVDCIKNPTSPMCLVTPCDTTKQDCRWPTSGTITQGPFTTCNSHTTHYSANAIDIGAAIKTPVYATTDGIVTSVVRLCPDNTLPFTSKCNGGYGNSVVIEAADKTYSLRYGHLLGSSITVYAGKGVKLGDAIGLVDQSGYSSGPHLHYEMINTSKNINSILPSGFKVLGCVNGVTGCSPCNYPAVGGNSK